MKKLLFVAFLAIFASTAYAGITPGAAQQDIGGEFEALGGATGICTIQYYNMCSGWVWTLTGNAGDHVGTVYDLPTDCGKLTTEVCEHLQTQYVCYENTPGYGFTFTIEMYDVDAQFCLLGGHGAITQDPANYAWNATPALGTTCSDFVAITYIWDLGPLPRVGMGPYNPGHPDCAGVVFPPVFYQWVYAGTPYCPPYLWYIGGCNVAMQEVSWFDCQEGTATKDANWGEVKNLFR